MELIDSSTFFNIIKSFEIIPYTQLKGMYDFHALSGTNRIHFFVNSINDPTIACFGHEKKFLNKKMILIEGECYANTSALKTERIRSFFSELCQLGYDFVEVCSNDKYNFDYETALRQAGYLRPVGQFSMPNTKIIDLTQEVKYNRNWKRNIKKAIGNELEFEIINDVNTKDCQDFQRMYQEMSIRKTMSQSLSVEQIQALCKTENFQLFFVLLGNVRIAGILIYKIKAHAGGGFAATNKIALDLSASFLMYSALFDYLKKNGFQTFDMEKLLPSTKSVNSVFLFKNGIEGKHIVLNGEWAWYKKDYYRPLMYFVKKYLMKKREI